MLTVKRERIVGRATELIDLINRKKMPNSDEQEVLYNYMSINYRIKKTRWEYRKELKRRAKCQEEG